MKIGFSEIWSFLRLMPGEEDAWNYRLVAGECQWTEANWDFVKQLEKDPFYDVELLPNLFIYREIFWQPNVYPTLSACITGLKLVANFSEELRNEYKEESEDTLLFYFHLVQFIGQLASRAVEMLESNDQAQEQIPAVLGEFRKQSFPVIMLLIDHPMNKPEYRNDADRRVNFMVKTLLDQYQVRFNDLMFPYWEVDRVIDRTKQPPQEEANQPSEES